MQYIYDSYTTAGRVKEINQDAIFLMEGETEQGNILFAAISDGMGGLAKGEEASAIMLDVLTDWFRNELPCLIYSKQGLTELTFRRSMKSAVDVACNEIESYARQYGADCGTTLSGILLYENKWYAVNVGDSRVYIHDGIELLQVTKDQTFVQREIDAGRLTPEEAKRHKMRSILLQCIGASEVVIPDWYAGELYGEQTILLCSDGFRHVVPHAEFEAIFNPSSIIAQSDIYERLSDCADRSMQAGERDNISAILIKTIEEVDADAGNRLSNRWEV